MRYLETFEKFIFGDSIEGMIQKYITDCTFDIEHELGNCAFFAKDFYLWAFKNDVDCKLVYFYQDENLVKNGEVEDHIVPMVDGNLIDFVWTENGVSRSVRKNDSKSINSQINPEITPLEYAQEKYGKFGYFHFEIITFNEAFLGKNPRCETIERPKRRF